MGGGASRPLGAMWWWWFLLSRASDAPRVKNFSSRGAGWVLDEKAGEDEKPVRPFLLNVEAISA